MRWILRVLTHPGDTVLDPYMGSGTTGVACRMEGRNFIGIELDPHYYAIAGRRIQKRSRRYSWQTPADRARTRAGEYLCMTLTLQAKLLIYLAHRAKL